VSAEYRTPSNENAPGESPARSSLLSGSWQLAAGSWHLFHVGRIPEKILVPLIDRVVVL